MLQDVWLALQRVLARSRPGTQDMGAFVGDELLGNAAGWSAGLSSAWLVDYFFVRRGISNLWGLAPGERMIVSGSQYEWLGTIASYLVGLVVLILVRHFVVGTVHELLALRAARGQQATGSPAIENRENA